MQKPSDILDYDALRGLQYDASATGIPPQFPNKPIVVNGEVWANWYSYVYAMSDKKEDDERGK